MNINTMSIDIDGKEYKLGLNRKAVKIAEVLGLTLDAFDTRPLNTIDLLWRASFLPNHPEITDKLAEDLYEKLEETNPEKIGEIIKFLTEQYGAFFKPLNSIK